MYYLFHLGLRRNAAKIILLVLLLFFGLLPSVFCIALGLLLCSFSSMYGRCTDIILPDIFPPDIIPPGHYPPGIRHSPPMQYFGILNQQLVYNCQFNNLSILRYAIVCIFKSELYVPVLPAFRRLFSSYRGEQCRATEVSTAAVVSNA